jgi:hypothetical protein
MIPTNQHIALLFGSGISCPAGLPSTANITERVLSGNGISRHTDSTYFSGPPLYGIPDQYVPKVILLLARLKSEIDNYYDAYDRARATNYEDLYSLASQIHDTELGDFDNPAPRSLIKQILADSENILHGKPHDTNGRWRLVDLCSEAMNYIRDVVWVELGKKPDNLSHLGFLLDAARDSAFKRKFIFTLNHDTLLETLFTRHSVSFIDGFESPVSQLRKWNPQLYEFGQTTDLLLLKLHGSINWFFFEKNNSYTLAIPLTEFWDKHPHVLPADGRPEILVGTLNKILEYTNPIYIDLQCAFNRQLNHCQHLIISGYSFGDTGINTRIIQWMYSRPSNRLIIIHPDADSLLERARTAIRNSWQGWQASQKLAVVPKAVENANWTDIQQML